MIYSPDFFALQLEFARRLAARFDLPPEETLREYTTLSKSLGSGEEWRAYWEGLQTAPDPVEWTYAWYLPRSSGGPAPGDTTFHGQPLFGCFYFAVRDEHIIRPHLIKNDAAGLGVLSRERQETRLLELRAMFAHIRDNVPEVDTVLGNSWMYNLEAYRRLFPPEYTQEMPESEEGEFGFLARWGQFFDREWRVKPALAQHLFDKLETLERLEDLRFCFPYQILQPQCAIGRFFAFYGL